MKMEDMLRQENYQLKNQITDLKNAFDLNRDILKILSNYNHKSDPNQHLLMQIITRLTTLNNQAMISCMELIQQKNVLKEQNLRMNLEIKIIEERLAAQIQYNRQCNIPNESKMMMQDQFNNLNRELMAANEERISKQQEIQFWKNRTAFQSETYNTNNMDEWSQNKIKRKYESNNNFKYEIMYKQMQKNNRKQKLYIQDLQNKLLVLIKAFNIKQENLLINSNRESYNFMEEQKMEIKLLKYALNDISIQKKEEEYILTITERFRDKDKMNNSYARDKRSVTWPKNKIKKEEDEEESEKEKRSRMEEREY